MRRNRLRWMLPVLGGGGDKQWAVVLGGGICYINATSEAALDNLPRLETGLTIEFYVKIPSTTAAWSTVFNKGSSYIYMQIGPTKGPYFLINYDTKDPVASSTTSIADDTFHHIACTYNEAGDRKARVFVDGLLVATSSASEGTSVDDSSDNLYFGLNLAITFGWIRISNNVRYATNFTPITRYEPLDTDANTILLYKVDEGMGTVLDNAEGTASRDGRILNGTWVNF